MTPPDSLPCVPLLPDERLDEVNEQIRLIQKKHGLTFGTDAYLLAAFIRPDRHAIAVDLGSGTGILPLLLTAKNKVSQVTAIEIQPSFSELIARNAALNGMSERIRPVCADVRTVGLSDIGGREADLVLSNPPYMRCDSGKRNERDEKYIARHEVCGGIYDFCAAAARLLRYGGKFVMVWRPDRLADLMNALRQAHLEPKRMTFVHADSSAEPSAVLTEAIKGGAPAMRVSPPLFLYLDRQEGETKRTLTPAAQDVYNSCKFYP